MTTSEVLSPQRGPQRGSINQAPGLLIQRAMQSKHIHLGQQLRQWNSPWLGGASRALGHQHFHAKGLRHPGHCLAQLTVADDSQDLAAAVRADGALVPRALDRLVRREVRRDQPRVVAPQPADLRTRRKRARLGARLQILMTDV